MNKSLVSSIAAAALVGSIGLVSAQSQSTDAPAQPAATVTDPSTQPATTGSSIQTTPSSSADPVPATTTSTMQDDAPLAARADRN